MLGETVNLDDAGKGTTQHWQAKLNTETSGRWRAKLLPDITAVETSVAKKIKAKKSPDIIWQV